ncbi:MAG: alpha/beta hydrolase [Allorhizobium sp.]
MTGLVLLRFAKGRLSAGAIAITLSLSVLVGCAGRPGPSTLDTVQLNGVQPSKRVAVYAVTTRKRVAPGVNRFDAGKSLAPNYAKFTVSIPPAHQVSKIEWPSGKPDPAKDFVVTSQQVLAAPDFDRDMAATNVTNQKIAIFVHGYNYNFPEALFRLAQMSVDANVDGTPILFSWPSQGAVSGYVADKEAVTYSRDYLVDMLISVSKTRKKGDIVLFGHSMGGWLVMEALRQLKLEGREDVLSRLEVVLAAPDIDTDVFRTQVTVVGKMSPPLTVLVSKDDRALKASSLLAADSVRIGALDVEDPGVRETALQQGVQIVDISGLNASDRLNHDRFVSFAALYPAIAAQTNKATLGQAGAFVFDLAGNTISSPFRLASTILAQ